MTVWQIEPLGEWGRPITAPRASSSRFRAGWDDTLRLLLSEIEHLVPTTAIAVRIDVQDGDLRRDGMLRARAAVDFPGVVVSFTSALHGPLAYATDAYEQRDGRDLPGWQANLRAIALSLDALRAVDRYGVSRSGEQYVGWRAIEAAPAPFPSADAALAWVIEQSGLHVGETTPSARSAYLAAVKRLHPDVGGDPGEWDRLDAAHRLLTAGGLL